MAVHIPRHGEDAQVEVQREVKRPQRELPGKGARPVRPEGLVAGCVERIAVDMEFDVLRTSNF